MYNSLIIKWLKTLIVRLIWNKFPEKGPLSITAFFRVIFHFLLKINNFSALKTFK